MAVAVNELRKLIFSGDLGAGTDHLESELATRLGMSRTPVREALLRLESQGLVEVRPRKGVRISPLSPNDLSEIYDVLIELESLAAANAAESGLSQKDLGVLTAAIHDMDAALAKDDREEWAKADDTFHQELVRLGRNKRVVQIIGIMSDQIRRARTVTLYMRPDPSNSSAEHQQIVDAILNGNADAARQAHRAHRNAAKQTLMDLLQRHRLHSI